jgi:hypothetical protein
MLPGGVRPGAAVKLDLVRLGWCLGGRRPAQRHQLRQGDTLVVWKLDRLGGRCATWSTPSPSWSTAPSDSEACRSRSTALPPRGKLVFHVFAPLPSSNATSSANGPAPGWPPPPGPWPLRRPAVGDDRPQAPSGPGDVRLRAGIRNCLRLLTQAGVDLAMGRHPGQARPRAAIKPAVAWDWKEATARRPSR